MRKLTKFFVPMLLAILVFLPVTQADQVAAAQFEDGEYNLSFQVLDGSGGTSTAADYLTSAKLIVENGQNKVQMHVKSSSMLKSLTVNGATASTVSSNEGNDTRVVQFAASTLDGNLSGSMHVVVPAEQLPPNGYDKNHTVTFKFNTSGIPTASGESVDSSDEETTEAGTPAPEENPPTGDNAPILLFSIVLLASGIFLVRKVAVK